MAANNNPHDSSSSSPSPSKAAPAKPATSTPWTKIVRGAGDPEPIAAAPPSPAAAVEPAVVNSIGEEEGGGGVPENVSAPNGNVGKRPAWTPPSNGPETVAAMEAQSWPPLAEAVKGPGKSSSDSLKGLADGLSSVSISQEGTEPAAPQKPAAEQRLGNQTLNHSVPTRQRSMKRNGATSPGGVSPHAPLLEQSAEMQPRASPRYHNPRGNFASQPHGGNDHQRQQRNSFRNRNGSMHGRGDGFNHQNFGGRHEQERGNQEWNSHRSFGNNRDQQQRPIPGPIRPPPPPPSLPYLTFPPSPVWTYSPMGFPAEVASPVYYVPGPPQDMRGVPFPISPQQVFIPAMDPHLPARILTQIEYYFSEENLIKDTYLRQNMDDQGWVSISLIAGFKKVSILTDNKNLILDSIQTSAIVEVQGDKVRKRNDWMRWIMPSSFQVSSSTTREAL